MLKTIKIFLPNFLIITSLINVNCQSIESNNDQNFISNGKFTENKCQSFHCISSDTDLVKDWIPDPELEIGYAAAFTDYFEYRTQRIIELTPNQDSCIKQQISALQPGYYKLTIESVARRDFPLSSGQFTISLNGSWLRTVTPANYKPHFQTFDVEVKNTCGAELKLCGIGKGTRKDGAVIKSVKMVLSSLDQQQPGTLPVMFCKFEPTQPGIYLDSESQNFFQKEFDFEAAEYSLSFDYEIISSAPVTQSDLVIAIDGVQFSRIPASQQGKNINLQLPNMTAGKHSLTKYEANGQNDTVYLNKISNIMVQKKVCISKWSQNLIINGGFQETTCTSLWCFYYQTNFVQQDLPGWYPKVSFELGRGPAFNYRFTSQRIVEIDPAMGHCLMQNLTLKPGKYILRFDRASKQSDPLTYQKFDVKMNGQIIMSYVSKNYQLQRQEVQFQLTSPPNLSILSFCGNTITYNGACIDNIELIYFDPCFQTQIVKSPSFPPNIIQIDQSYVQPNANEKVIDILSDPGTCTEIKYELLGGKINIKFDFSVLTLTQESSSALLIFFDGEIVRTVSFTENGNQISVQISNVIAGSRVLKFCPFQSPSEQAHTAKVSNLVLQETLCNAKWTANLIINGDFQQTTCPNNSCVYNQNTWQQSVLPGWIPYPEELKVGVGSAFNTKMGATKVVFLDASKNTCIQQKLLLKTGKYTLSFITGAHKDGNLSSQGLEVRINSRLLKRITHADYFTTLQKVDFTLDSVYTDGNYLEFCGIGLGDTFGSIIDDVKISYYDECQSNQTFIHSF